MRGRALLPLWLLLRLGTLLRPTLLWLWLRALLLFHMLLWLWALFLHMLLRLRALRFSHMLLRLRVLLLHTLLRLRALLLHMLLHWLLGMLLHVLLLHFLPEGGLLVLSGRKTFRLAHRMR